jgi:hypothetical protein
MRITSLAGILLVSLLMSAVAPSRAAPPPGGGNPGPAGPAEPAEPGEPTNPCQKVGKNQTVTVAPGKCIETESGAIIKNTGNQTITVKTDGTGGVESIDLGAGGTAEYTGNGDTFSVTGGAGSLQVTGTGNTVNVTLGGNSGGGSIHVVGPGNTVNNQLNTAPGQGSQNNGGTNYKSTGGTTASPNTLSLGGEANNTSSGNWKLKP